VTQGKLENANYLFDLLDVDQNGYISLQEFKTFMSENGFKMSTQTAKFVFSMWDVDGDDQISFEEFYVRHKQRDLNNSNRDN